MPMTADAKSALSKTIRALRERLLTDLHDATESAYRLSVPARDAALEESKRIRRARLDDWLDEQERVEQASKPGKKAKRRTRDDLRREVEKQAAYTLLNRLIILRLMEADGPSGEPLRAPALVSGGWRSPAYRQFTEVAPALIGDDPTEGYGFLLQLVFEDLAIDLPGLYGSVGVADLIPVPPATLRHTITELNAPAIDSCWTDDMTLGWVYQYWNDPEREALDAKLNRREKLENHEIASKTQMFTERYMVDWLLQNSLNPMWLAMCKKHGWTPQVQADGTLAALEARRVDWRAQRAAGTVELTDLMPLHTDAERRWAYYLEQPIPDEAVTSAPDTIRDIKILDPAAGSGHFLVVAVDLLFALYKEEAAHRGESEDEKWSNKACIERILSHNLHGIDLDPRAMQIAAAALWLKAKHLVPDARPTRINLVASNLGLANLPPDDPALATLRAEIERETGIPGKLTDTIFNALKGADHLGSLLKVDQAVEKAISQHEAFGRETAQQGLFPSGPAKQPRVPMTSEEAKTTLLERLERFLGAHTSSEDLGLRLHGEQLAKGVRFVRMVQEGVYDILVGNPPYLGSGKLKNADWYTEGFCVGKSDLYAGFFIRSISLIREYGVAGMITISNWMFINSYTEFRQFMSSYQLRCLADLGKAAFSVGGTLISTACAVWSNNREYNFGRAVRTFDVFTVVRDDSQFIRTESALRSQETVYSFDTGGFSCIDGAPIMYWWSGEFIESYANMPKIGHKNPAREGITTANNARFRRWVWEQGYDYKSWFPFVVGASGRKWIEPLFETVFWRWSGLQIKTLENSSVRNEAFQGKRGVAFTTVGSNFGARIYRVASIFEAKGRSIFSEDNKRLLCSMNKSVSVNILESLNPSIDFTVGDVNRLPVFNVEGAGDIVDGISAPFSVHESHREPSVEFLKPGPSPWRHAQEWAQEAVDRPEGAPLPEYVEQLDPEPPTDHISFALGVALGRFGAAGSAQEGILDPATADLSHALPHGILLLDGTLDKTETKDDLGHDAAAVLHAAWAKYGAQIDTRKNTVRDYLRLEFFKNVHVKMYEKRPIHWPLSSEKKTFVAWVNIHRWTADTLTELLAKLVDVEKRLDGEIADQQEIRDGDDSKASRAADKRLDKLRGWKAELAAFTEQITACAEEGPPPTAASAAKCPPRERNARYAPDLDDGVMINSAALWPLLLPQWKDPKKWWTELAKASGRKDYDWSHLAMRYYPTRVDAKCHDDPSLGVAHGCFWLYHPERAWAWELRLQDEIGADFRIEEAGYTAPNGTVSADHTALRAAYLAAKWEEAVEAVQKEALRRHGRGKNKKLVEEMTLLERGLWSLHPAACWDLEIALSEKQGIEFFLRAPDEPEARAAFAEAHPERVAARKALVAALEPVLDLFDDDDDEEDDNDDIDGEDAEDEDEESASDDD